MVAIFKLNLLFIGSSTIRDMTNDFFMLCCLCIGVCCGCGSCNAEPLSAQVRARQSNVMMRDFWSSVVSSPQNLQIVALILKVCLFDDCIPNDCRFNDFGAKIALAFVGMLFWGVVWF